MNINCQIQNHNNMPLQYTCLNQNCIRTGRVVGCLNCCQETHQSHLQNVIAMKVFLHDLATNNSIQQSEYNLKNILLSAIQHSENQQQLTNNVKQLIALKNNPNKYNKLIDRQAKLNQQNVKSFYQNRINLKKTQLSQNLYNSQNYNFIEPVLNFKQSQHFTLNSPFKITHNKQGLHTTFAYPSLNRFHQSIQTKIKIAKLTPNWIGVGVSFDQKQYIQGSKNHILVLSNGWLIKQGIVDKCGIRFNINDIVIINWNKLKGIIQFNNQNQQCLVNLQNKWNRQINICVVLFYKHDSIQILV